MLNGVPAQGNRCRKAKRNRYLGSVQDSQMEREKILSEQRDLHNFFERKANQAFQGEGAAQTRLSEVQSELDRREWKIPQLFVLEKIRTSAMRVIHVSL